MAALRGWHEADPQNPSVWNEPSDVTEMMISRSETCMNLRHWTALKGHFFLTKFGPKRTKRCKDFGGPGSVSSGSMWLRCQLGHIEVGAR